MSQRQSEFVVRVPKKNEMKRYSVLKFNAMDNIDTAKWTGDSLVELERVDNKGIVLSSQVVQDYGEGTEYGKAAREEARRKKYGRQARSYQIDNQPWRLQFREADGRTRKMRSIKEGGAGEHADYWVFLKVGDEFHAHKMTDWHKFMPAITHKTLDIDQAEEKFLQRNRVMNQFALKAQILNQLKDDEGGEQLDKASKSLKIKDDYSSDDSEDDTRDVDATTKQKKPSKKKKPETKKKDKRQRVENEDDVAKYESSDGEDEGREYDYMSDSGSDSDREEIKVEEKVDAELVGVGDETGLKKLIGSDEDTDSDEESLEKKLFNRDEDGIKKERADPDDRDSSDSDSDDPDKGKINSVMFLPEKAVSDSTTASSASNSSTSIGKKRANDGGDESEAKRAKVDEALAAAAAVPEGLNEATVRKYLRRKPHNTKELLAKMKPKCADMSKGEIVSKLAAILKAIEPHRETRRVNNKDVLYFSLTNTLA